MPIPLNYLKDLNEQLSRTDNELNKLYLSPYQQSEEVKRLIACVGVLNTQVSKLVEALVAQALAARLDNEN